MLCFEFLKRLFFNMVKLILFKWFFCCFLFLVLCSFFAAFLIGRLLKFETYFIYESYPVNSTI